MSQRYSTTEEAFEARTEPLVGDPGCLLWMGAIKRSGYGVLRVEGRQVMAHRYAWERVNGPIPEGMIVDHVCHVRSCVESSHLRPATNRENQRNRAGAVRGRKRNLPRGVTARGRNYYAYLYVDGTQRHLGTFHAVEQAAEAARIARAATFGAYAGGN